MHPEEIVYYVNSRGAKRGVIFYLILSLAFLFFHLYVSPNLGETDFPSTFKALAHIAGIGGIVGFSTLGLIFLRRLFSKEPYIVVNTSGIYDNASGMWSGSGWVEWSEIADVRLSKYHNLPCVELAPKNRERFLQRFNWMERINRSSRLGYPAIALRGPLLPVEPALLAEQIRDYWRNALNTQCSRLNNTTENEGVKRTVDQVQARLLKCLLSRPRKSHSCCDTVTGANLSHNGH